MVNGWRGYLYLGAWLRSLAVSRRDAKIAKGGPMVFLSVLAPLRENPGRIAGRLHRLVFELCRFLRVAHPAVAVVSLLLLICLVFPAGAQDPFGGLLIDADKLYRSGDFEKVIELLTPCIGSDAPRKVKVEAYRLLAMTYLASDRFDAAREAVGRLLMLKPDLQITLHDPPGFVKMVEDAKLAGAAILVTSVSKNSENIREAPATVVVITEEDLRRRGYLDLESLFHDLSGFDISRGNGVLYSCIYQRGYRSNGTDKTLFLFDGVEENDIWTNFTYLSRQYPISNIERIEVIYGPASTMYGANAFLGVVNVITREPGAFVEKGRKFGVRVQANTGQWGTRYVDATVAARHENVAMSVTGRLFRSNEMDLSAFPEWDYALHDTDFYKEKLAVAGLNDDGAYRAQAFLDDNTVDSNHPYVSVARNADGVATDIGITDAGAEKARDLDRVALNAQVGGHPVRYTNHTDDWFLNGKIRSGGLTVGFQTWRRTEGTIGWFVDDREGASRNGGVWIPRNTFLYMKYDKPITENLFLTFFNRYKSHSLDSDNRILIHRSYSGEGRWGLKELLVDELSRWSVLYFYELSKELRMEAKVLYAPSERLNLVSGVELRNGHIQGEYVVSAASHPAETGGAGSLAGGNHFEHRDIGFYAQASGNLREDVKLILGGRVDHNRIRDTGGFGTVFNSRVAAVYSPSVFVFKAIYSEAFKAASNWAKYATSPSRGIPNPDLKPEVVKNLELSAGWQVSEAFSVDAAGYAASYSDVVGTTKVVLPDGSTTTQNQAIGRLRIRGLQVGAVWRHGRYTLGGNYTYTDPINSQPTDKDGNPLLDAQGNPQQIRIGDIAGHRINLEANALLADHLNINLRMNFVGDRPTGKDTTIEENPHDRIDAYTILNGALTYRDIVPGLSMQLVVQNVLNANYFHPGVRSADGKILASRLPQNTRNMMLRLLMDF